MTIHRVPYWPIMSQRLTDSRPPRTVVRLVTRTSLGTTTAGVKGIFFPPARFPKGLTLSALVQARRFGFRLAPRARDGSNPAFSHLRLLPASPDRRAWAPLSWTGRLTPGVSVALLPATVPGRAGWIKLHKGPNRIPRLLFRIRLLPSKPLRPFAFEPPRPLLFCADCSSPP